MSDTKTNVSEFIGELNAGILIQQVGALLSEVALATTINGNKSKKGKVGLSFTITPMNEGQVVITTKLDHLIHTKTGEKTEKSVSQTPMFVGKGGVMTINQPKEDLNGQFGLESQKDGIRAVK